MKLVRHTSARDYGISLRTVGFVSLGQLTGPYDAGDLGIVSPIPGHPHGHMAIYNGDVWIADFNQLHGLTTPSIVMEVPLPLRSSLVPPSRLSCRVAILLAVAT